MIHFSNNVMPVMKSPVATNSCKPREHVSVSTNFFALRQTGWLGIANVLKSGLSNVARCGAEMVRLLVTARRL
jgi:hypothetical protein